MADLAVGRWPDGHMGHVHMMDHETGPREWGLLSTNTSHKHMPKLASPKPNGLKKNGLDMQII